MRPSTKSAIEKTFFISSPLDRSADLRNRPLLGRTWH